jgi:hypothetical protein
MMAGYWGSRAGLDYYRVVKEILERLGPQASVLDVGSWDTPVATWGDFDERYTVDPRPRPVLPGVTAVVGSWPDCATEVPVCDVVTCLQVLEHLAEPTAFCGPLFEHARRAVIISVPWGWPAVAEPSHVHDPVDAEKLRAWTGLEPDELRIVPGRGPRAVAVYRLQCGDVSGWSGLF